MILDSGSSVLPKSLLRCHVRHSADGDHILLLEYCLRVAPVDNAQHEPNNKKRLVSLNKSRLGNSVVNAENLIIQSNARNNYDFRHDSRLYHLLDAVPHFQDD